MTSEIDKWAEKLKKNTCQNSFCNGGELCYSCSGITIAVADLKNEVEKRIIISGDNIPDGDYMWMKGWNDCIRWLIGKNKGVSE